MKCLGSMATHVHVTEFLVGGQLLEVLVHKSRVSVQALKRRQRASAAKMREMKQAKLRPSASSSVRSSSTSTMVDTATSNRTDPEERSVSSDSQNERPEDSSS